MSLQNDPIRFGIIGLGVGRSRVKQAANTAGAQLVAVCDLQGVAGHGAGGGIRLRLAYRPPRVAGTAGH